MTNPERPLGETRWEPAEGEYVQFPGVDDETADAISHALRDGYVDPVDHDD